MTRALPRLQERPRDNHIRLAGRRFLILAAVVPAMVFFAVWLIIPVILSLIMSLHEWSPLAQDTPYIGLDNYIEALTVDALFGQTVKNTFYYMVLVVPIGSILALIAAVMINSLRRLRGLFRVIYFLPVVTSGVAVAILWKALYQGRFGVFTQILQKVLVDTLHLPINPSVQWLTSKYLAMPSVTAMVIWQSLGFTMIIFLAGLSSIPQVFYEASMIDGASAFQRFRHITLPLLRPTVLFVAVTGVIGALQVFTSIFILTQGGPVNSTRSIVYHLYGKAFQQYRFGYASAIGMILFAMILVITLVQLRFLRTKWDY